MGAFLGDYVEVGCNAVLTPGTVVGVNTIIYPLVMARGVIEKNKIVKSMNNVVERVKKWNYLEQMESEV